MYKAEAKKAIILTNLDFSSKPIEVVEGHIYAITYKINNSSGARSETVTGRVSKIVEAAVERSVFNNRTLNQDQIFTLFVDVSSNMMSKVLEIPTYNIETISLVINEEEALNIGEIINNNFKKLEINVNEDGTPHDYIIKLFGAQYGSCPVEIHLDSIVMPTTNS